MINLMDGITKISLAASGLRSNSMGVDVNLLKLASANKCYISYVLTTTTISAISAVRVTSPICSKHFVYVLQQGSKAQSFIVYRNLQRPSL
uniref:Uncharacterized protein n=1 Tax=Nelumbo nucifera TaxID=4432 RepID=A0A822Y5H2_NELNU|nr:TPA_asm: hypothetical protein HUJ06_029175 [Nelumbo nucifera]